jgi:hypothetical protein
MGERDALRRRKAFFAYFLLPFGQKVGRLAGRDPPVFQPTYTETQQV